MALDPRFSPDGRRLAMFISNGPGSDLWVYDIDRTTKTRLTSGLAGRDAVWSPDGQFIVFQAPGGMFWTRADGAGKPQALLAPKTYARPGSFSPDGRLLAYMPNPYTAEVAPSRPCRSRSFLASTGRDRRRFSYNPPPHRTSTPDSRTMGTGSHTTTLSREPSKSMSAHFQIGRPRGRSPIPAGSFPSGRPMAANCSTAAQTIASWWWTTVSEAMSSLRINLASGATGVCSISGWHRPSTWPPAASVSRS